MARKIANRIIQRQDATASLEPGKSTGAPRKTTARQECALFRMVREHRFQSARGLTEMIRNLYAVRVGRKTMTTDGRRLPARLRGYQVPSCRGFCPRLGGIPQGCPLCCWISTSMAWCIGTSCGTPWYHSLGSTLEKIFATKMTILRLIMSG